MPDALVVAQIALICWNWRLLFFLEADVLDRATGVRVLPRP